MQDKKTFELTHDQLDAIIVQELKDKLKMELSLTNSYRNRTEFFDSFLFVLKQYMNEHEYRDYVKQFK